MGNLTFVIGLLAFLLGALFVTGSNYLAGILLIVGSSSLLTYRTEFMIDAGLIISQKIWFLKLNSKAFKIPKGAGTIELINSIFGSGNRFTFFTYDVIYVKANHHKVHIFTSTNIGHADKVATFISENLNLVLENRPVFRER